MRDPRWLPPELGQLLQRAAADYDVSPERVTRMGQRLERALADGGGGGGGAGGLPWPTLGVGLAGLLTIAALVHLQGAGAPLQREVQVTLPPTPVYQAVPRPAPAAPPAPAAAPAPPPAPAAAPAPPPRTMRRALRDTLALEVRLIAAARRAVKARPARALALTARHLARFPRGQLAQEREVLAVEALVRLERRAAACARAARLLAAAPHSSYRLRLRGLLGPGECPSPER